jgi:hypothetical protein
LAEDQAGHLAERHAAAHSGGTGTSPKGPFARDLQPAGPLAGNNRFKSVESRCGAVALGSNISVPASFVWRCLIGSTMAPFPHLAHRTGHVTLLHTALGQTSRLRPKAVLGACLSDVRFNPTNSHRRARASGPKRANRRLIHRSKRYCCRPDRSGPELAAARQKQTTRKYEE